MSRLSGVSAGASAGTDVSSDAVGAGVELCIDVESVARRLSSVFVSCHASYRPSKH